ncbi:hypothetical protein [Staphylococcus hominis]|uniref:hypothetical protein n=1 Tax=Staphylococcus hominis TaxID=1290 RepID=UPI001F55B5F8|nr:hypothetical protein [Staphylococcus hominis]MCI2878490.1 hypothetical protein [Staphylococcus hominis]
MNAEAKFVSSVMDARLKKAKRERDAYKKQRDELINDMAEVKRKAEAFDEIKELVNWFEENDRYEFEGQVGKIIKIINDLERGSDE